MSPSQILFNQYYINWLNAILWQWDNSPELISLMTQKMEWYQTLQGKFWNDWEKNVFDLRTADAFGLQVWAIILNQEIQGPIPGVQNNFTFGFGAYNQNFGHGNFSSELNPVQTLTIDQQRILLQLRYYQLISPCTVTEINAMLENVLGGNGSAYVLDGGNMHIRYVFNLPPSSDLEVVLENFNVLPRPAGVGVDYITRTKAFGFGSFNQNFNNGTFLQ